MSIYINSNKVLKALLISIIFLVIANSASIIFSMYNNNIFIELLQRLFKLDFEANVPTWYSSITLLICSILLAIITLMKEGDRYRLHWGVLSLIFLYLSMDEVARIHELADNMDIVIGSLKNISYFSNYYWVIIAIPLIIIFILAYMRFLFDLPKNIQFLFFLSGILFIGGAIGVELIGGWWIFSSGTKDIIYEIFATLEEMLEMLGVAIFIYALLTYISECAGEIIIRVQK